MKKYFVYLLLPALVLSACNPFTLPADDVSVDGKRMNELIVPDGFNYATTRTFTVRISAVDNAKNTLKNLPVSLYRVNQESSATPDLVSTGWIGADGVLEVQFELPAAIHELIVRSTYPGLPATTVSTDGLTSADVVLGASNQAGDRSDHALEHTSQARGAGDRSGDFSYLGSFDDSGVPYYLEPEGDNVSQDILDMIAASLPESQPVPAFHPEYIANGTQTNTVLTEDAEVWITFVHEGAGYRNSIGYYSYPSNNPPQTVDDIDDLKIIFPNVSYPGYGGNLHTGDKVYLGIFPAGTTVAWFLVPDGWSPGIPGVDDTYHPTRYSDKVLNTFTTEPYQSHVVQLVDPARELLLLGFEDLDRPGGDNDFNDAIFYITATPFTAVNRTNMAETSIGGNDQDGDGIPDNSDTAPTDPSYAFRTFTPSEGSTGTLAFEDFFPTKGDYDMNDMVVDYNIEERMNAANKVVQIKFHLTLRAIGAGFRNGFGIELPVPASYVSSVTGSKINEQYIVQDANGTESGQSSAVIIAFDNSYALMSTSDGGFINTEKDKENIEPYSFEVSVIFNQPISRAELGDAPYNPFLIVDRNRGREVHLAGKQPTDLADMSLFQTGDDDSTPGGSKTYLTANNLPWALNLPESFPYPTEKTPINQAYLKFNQWAESAGGIAPDWYKANPGNRNPQKLY
jgi:LruC domain-containing protein